MVKISSIFVAFLENMNFTLFYVVIGGVYIAYKKCVHFNTLCKYHIPDNM